MKKHAAIIAIDLAGGLLCSVAEQLDGACRATRLETEILAYLAQHPHAMDTIGGIAGWWLDGQAVRVDMDTLSRALGRLVSRGVVEMVGGQREPLYRLRDRAKHLKP